MHANMLRPQGTILCMIHSCGIHRILEEGPTRSSPGDFRAKGFSLHYVFTLARFEGA
jgi:hypothetical protein